MSWNDIVIGECETSGSATVIPSQRGIYAPVKGTKTCKSHISESGRSYWIRTDFLDMDMRIAKKHETGVVLAALLASENWEDIDKLLADVVLANATPVLIRKKIAEAVKESYSKGYDDKAFEIRKALGIDRNW